MVLSHQTLKTGQQKMTIDRNWLIKQPPEVLQAFMQSTTVPMLWTGKAGEIYWANPAFEEWSGYTLSELQAIGWMKISSNDGALQADIQSVAAVVDGYRKQYVITKQYIPKNDRPQWGELSVTPFYSTDEQRGLLFFQCTWLPLKENTSHAFDLAVARIQKNTEELVDMRATLLQIAGRDQDEDWIISTVRAARRHPILMKALIIGAMAAGGTTSLNAIIEFAQRLGFAPPPAVADPGGERPTAAMFSDPIDAPEYMAKRR